MEDLIGSIRAAIAPDASTETKAAGATACRAILSALDSKPGEPLTATIPTPTPPIAQLASALRGMPPDQLLDLAIARLRAALPAGTDAPPVPPIRFHLPRPVR